MSEMSRNVPVSYFRIFFQSLDAKKLQRPRTFRLLSDLMLPYKINNYYNFNLDIEISSETCAGDPR